MSHQIGFRLPEDTVRKFDELVRITGHNRTTYFVALVEQEYDKLEGSPKMKKALQALRECEEIIRKAGLVDEGRDCKIIIEGTKDIKPKKPRKSAAKNTEG